MNKTTLTASAAIVAGAVATRHYRNSVKLIMDRFPLLNLDYKTASRAYRIMIKRAFQGAYENLDSSDKTNDNVFLGIVTELRSK